jgi:hypothetical protein
MDHRRREKSDSDDPKELAHAKQHLGVMVEFRRSGVQHQVAEEMYHHKTDYHQSGDCD